MFRSIFYGGVDASFLRRNFVNFSIIGTLLAWGIPTYGIYWILNWMFGLPFLFWILAQAFMGWALYRQRYEAKETYIWHR